MKILVLGGAGFIGTNLIKNMALDGNNLITVVDEQDSWFGNIHNFQYENVQTVTFPFLSIQRVDNILENQDVVYHLVSTTKPSTSNTKIADEIEDNIVFTVKLLESCVRKKVKKIIFLSSGGTVYGKVVNLPISENAGTNPINSYGLQKLTIEKLLFIYRNMYGLDYKIIRLANPYGPYQRPNGVLGAVTTFVHKALRDEEIIIYGDGNIVRDFIYVDDAVKCILNIATMKCNHDIYNIGSGVGTSINELLAVIENVLGKTLKARYTPVRNVDVPVNYLDITRYKKDFGDINMFSLQDGIRMTAQFMIAHPCLYGL